MEFADWSALVSRIALRGVSEWDEAFKRVALIAALPDLADANPRVIDPIPPIRNTSPEQSGKRVKRIGMRVLDRDMSWHTIVHMLADPKDCRGLGAGIAVPRFGEEYDNPRQILHNALRQTIEQSDWHVVPSLLDALFRSGVDIRESGLYVLQQALKKGWWRYASDILDALSRSGVDRLWIDRPGKSIASLQNEISEAASEFDTVPTGAPGAVIKSVLEQTGLSVRNLSVFCQRDRRLSVTRHTENRCASSVYLQRKRGNA